MSPALEVLHRVPAVALAAVAVSATGIAQEGSPDVAFGRSVLPLLSDRCYACHGPDAEARKAGLRLDEPIDGEVAAELLRRVASSDPEQRMPPPDSNLSLAPDEVATLRRWVEAGAVWGRHWSFVAPQPPRVPVVAKADWPRHDLDRFVLAQLEARGVQPSPPAAAGALLRRVSLDLTGLPPTPEELDAFVADPSDAAYERVVDRLLASPRYGERMAWPWLEAGRYADTDGYQSDPVRVAWPWRDWLVRALNDNVPFDRFTIEAIAGDLLPDATAEQRLATGFLRNNAHNGEGGRIAEETRVENVFDRTETVATVWMGLTFACARCHDHKYDPISQRDYYGLSAFFDQTSESGGGRSAGVLAPAMRYLDSAERQQLVALEGEVVALDGWLFADDPEWLQQQLAWEAAVKAAVLAEPAARQPAQLGAWRRSEQFAPPDGKADAMFATAFAPEASADGDAPGWQPEPQLVDGEPLGLGEGQYTVYFRRVIEVQTARRMTVSLGSDDAIKVWCNGDLVLANDVRRGVAPDQERAVLPLRPGRNTLLIKIVNTGGRGGVYFRRVDETVGELPGAVARALLRPMAERSGPERRAVRTHYRRLHLPGWVGKERERQRLAARRAELQGRGLSVSVMDQLPRERQRTTRVLERGNYRQPGAEVTAAVPGFLPPLRGATGSVPTRLALARWLVSGDHPLTARVAVNRAWQTIFGRGLVATSEDFGRQGDRPSHPQLLDWLAHRFVASGWDHKALHRLLVTSSTYRQAAAAAPAAFAADPHNVWLARSSRARWPAWMLRDQALALSGRLAGQLGGPPVRPYQPEGIWAEATFGTIRYQQDSGAALRRRSLYVFWRRIVGPTVFFDTPSRQACVVGRSTTNTPLHALTTLNETGFVEAARGLAERAVRAAATTDQSLAWLFRAAVARRPDHDEMQLLRLGFARHLAHFAADAEAAAAVLQVGETAPDPQVSPAELAAWWAMASIVLNLDEVLTRP